MGREKSKEEEDKLSKVATQSSPPSPIISRKRPLFPQRLPPSVDRLPETLGIQSPTTLQRSPVLRRRQRVAKPRLPQISGTSTVASTDDQKECKRAQERVGGGAGIIPKEDGWCSRREARVLVGSSWIANLSRMEEAESWTSGEVKRTEEKKEEVRGAEVATDRLLGSSWIADLPHMGEEVEGGSQCSASIGSWEGEAKVQPFGDKSAGLLLRIWLKQGKEKKLLARILKFLEKVRKRLSRQKNA